MAIIPTYSNSIVQNMYNGMPFGYNAYGMRITNTFDIGNQTGCDSGETECPGMQGSTDCVKSIYKGQPFCTEVTVYDVEGYPIDLNDVDAMTASIVDGYDCEMGDYYFREEPFPEILLPDPPTDEDLYGFAKETKYEFSTDCNCKFPIDSDEETDRDILEQQWYDNWIDDNYVGAMDQIQEYAQTDVITIDKDLYYDSIDLERTKQLITNLNVYDCYAIALEDNVFNIDEYVEGRTYFEETEDYSIHYRIETYTDHSLVWKAADDLLPNDFDAILLQLQRRRLNDLRWKCMLDTNPDVDDPIFWYEKYSRNRHMIILDDIDENMQSIIVTSISSNLYRLHELSIMTYIDDDMIAEIQASSVEQIDDYYEYKFVIDPSNYGSSIKIIENRKIHNITDISFDLTYNYQIEIPEGETVYVEEDEVSIILDFNEEEYDTFEISLDGDLGTSGMLSFTINGNTYLYNENESNVIELSEAVSSIQVNMQNMTFNSITLNARNEQEGGFVNKGKVRLCVPGSLTRTFAAGPVYATFTVYLKDETEITPYTFSVKIANVLRR